MSFEREFDKWLTTTPDDILNPITECETCGAELYEGYDVVFCEGNYFCDTECLLNYFDYRYETLAE